MIETLKRGWWLLVIRAACAVLFGVLMLALPGVTLAALVFLFGAYAIANGISTVGLAVRAPKGAPGVGTILILGLLGIAAGVLTFVYPGTTALSLLWIIALWAISTGVFEVLVAVRLRKELRNEWLLVLSGALSVAFGVLIVFNPGAGALSVIWLIATYAIFFGVTMLMFAFRVRALAAPPQTTMRTA